MVDVATFATSLTAIWLVPRMPPHENAERAGVRSMIHGFRFLRRQPVILGIFLLDTNAMAFGMSSALLPAFAAHRYGGGAQVVVGLLYGGRVSGIELAQVASAPALGNVEAGVVALATSLRFSVGIACIVGTAVILAALPALLRYDARRGDDGSR